VISHAASDTGSGEMIVMADRLNELMAQQTVPRSRRQVARFFTGLDLLEPGLVGVQQWRPARTPTQPPPPRCGPALPQAPNQGASAVTRVKPRRRPCARPAAAPR